MKASSVAFVIAVAFSFCSFGEPVFAQGKGKGKGIGNSVSQLAKNGVHGKQLAGQVHQLQRANGIGQVNGGGNGGPPAGKGVGMVGGKGGGKGGPPAGKGAGKGKN